MKIRLILPLSAFLVLTVLPVAGWAAETYKDISSREAREMLNSQKEGLLLLDVRTEREYSAGHLKNSKLIPIQVLADRLEEIDKYRDKEIIIYCAVGGRSSKASSLLMKNGFKKVYNMNGGIKAWTKNGYEVER